MRKSKASSEELPPGVRDPALARIRSKSLFLELEKSQFDLLTVLIYMSSTATANLNRSQLFEGAARLGYSPSPYFAKVANLAGSLGYDYAEACHVVSRSCKDEVMKQFLLRFGNSMASGEPESVFLAREAHVAMEDYTNEYERSIETLRKWTDAFIALMVSCNLIVLVSLIANMIYNMGLLFMLAVEAVSLISAAMGAYLMYRIAPYDPVVHGMEHKSKEQRVVLKMSRVLLPAALLSGALAYFALGDLAVGLVFAGLLVLPVGIAAQLLERKIDNRDRDISDFLRALGGVTAARGSTVIESLHHIDRKAIGSLEPELKRLMTRVALGLNTTLSWGRFMAETGSELVHRVVRSFWDGNDWGGDPEKIGRFSADMALRVWLLRAKRKLVSSTFNYVVIPMHVSLVATLVFVTEVIGGFNNKLLEAQDIVGQEQTSIINPEELGIPNALSFQSFDVELAKLLVLGVALTLTFINAFAPRSAAGGSHFKMAFFGGLTMICTGLILLITPPMARMIFSDTLTQPVQ